MRGDTKVRGLQDVGDILRRLRTQIEHGHPGFFRQLCEQSRAVSARASDASEANAAPARRGGRVQEINRWLWLPLGMNRSKNDPDITRGRRQCISGEFHESGFDDGLFYRENRHVAKQGKDLGRPSATRKGQLVHRIRRVQTSRPEPIQEREKSSSLQDPNETWANPV